MDSFGFYDPSKWPQDPKQNSAWNAYARSTTRRYLSPGIAPECFVVRHHGYKGQYNDISYITSQYAYASVYDAMRQISVFKADEYEGKIELAIYTDAAGLEIIRTWEFVIEGFQNMNGDYEIENSGWVKA
jgi:hypothetical protein